MTTFITHTDSVEWALKMLWKEIDRKGYGTDEEMKKIKELQEELAN